MRKKSRVIPNVTMSNLQKSYHNTAVIGMGLMGTSIITCLLAAGHKVIGIDKNIERCKKAKDQIKKNLAEMSNEGFLAEHQIEPSLNAFQASQNLHDLSDAKIAIETIVENQQEKENVIRQLEEVLPETSIIGSNTSAIPISDLQNKCRTPERVIGIHWAEPAHITRFLEIICGNQTNPDIALVLKELAECWGKEPSVLYKDIRGFITNRIMYAVIREAFYLVENGYCNIEDVDRSVRNDLGSWITLAGPFRWMDLTGIPAYGAVIKDLFKELSNQKDMPKLMQKALDEKWNGTHNGKGFYQYDQKLCDEWKQKFSGFSYDIRKLMNKYKESSIPMNS